MSNLEELQLRLEALCDEQEKLYRTDFEVVFKVLYEIDITQKSIYDTSINIWEDLPNKADRTIIQNALEKAGFSDDVDFCRAFIRYADIVIEGTKIIQERTSLQLQSTAQEESEENEPRWRFIPVRIIAPKEIMDNVINPMLEADAKEGIGFYANITDIPEEDESLDEWFDIEAYGIRCSLEPLYRDLQKYNVVNSILGDKTIRDYYLSTIKSLIHFISDNTDKPNKIRNHISKTLKELDDIPAWGLLLQILLLQGLIKWFEDVDLKDGDSGYKEACILVRWIGQQLMKKEVWFCFFRWGEEDKKLLKPFCDYLYSTEIGKIVQEHIFHKDQKDAKDVSLPAELDTEEAKSLFQKVEYCIPDGDLYRWTGSSALFGFFVDWVSIHLKVRPSNNRIPWKIFKIAFQRSDSDIETAKQAVNNYQNKELSKPEGYLNIIKACE